MPSRGFGTEAVGDLPALESRASEWQSLFEAADEAHLASSYPYVFANASERMRGRGWRVFVTRAGHEWTAALFGVEASLSTAFFRVPVFQVGTEFVGDVLCRDLNGDALPELVNAVFASGSWPVVDFGKLSEPHFRAMTSQLERLSLGYVWNHEGYGYVSDATTGMEALYAAMSYSTRGLVRRTHRRIFKDLRGEIRHTRPADVNESLRDFERFVELEHSGWKGRKGTSIRSRPGSEAYFRAVVTAATRLGMMRWQKLLVDQRPVAMNMGLVTGSTYWAPKTAYDEEFSRYSPGLELNHQLFTDCMEDPDIQRINWISAPEWLDSWRPNRLPYYHLRVFGRSVTGRCLRLANSAKAGWGRYVSRRDSEQADRERRFL